MASNKRAGYSSPFELGNYSNELALGGFGYSAPQTSPLAPTGVEDAAVATPGMFSGLSDFWKGDGFFGRNSLLGGTNEKGVTTKGWAPVALGLGQAIFGGIQGQNALKLANSQFKEQKRQFDLNYGAQRQAINTELEDRQRARVASNPGAYESVSSYLDKNRIQ